MADNLNHLHVPIVLKYGSLNLLECCGPAWACNGTALPLQFYLGFFSGRAVGCEAAETETEIDQWHKDSALLCSFRAASWGRQFGEKAERKCSRMSQVWQFSSEYSDQTSLINFVLIHRRNALSWLSVCIKRSCNVWILMLVFHSYVYIVTQAVLIWCHSIKPKFVLTFSRTYVHRECHVMF